LVFPFLPSVQNVCCDNRIRKIVEVPPSERNATLDHLDPSREYFLQVVAVSFLGTMNESRPVLFVSPANDSANNPPNPYFGRYPGYGYARKVPKFRQRVGIHNTGNPYASPYDSHDHNLELPFIKIDEAIIVTVVLCVWFSIIVLFCNKWGKIRHLEPYQPDYHKRESTDTEVIVDPFSSFSATHYNPQSKHPSRMNTLNTTNNNNSVSMSNFASIETNAGVNFMTSTTNDKLSIAKRKASLSLNEVNDPNHHRRTYSHGSGTGLRFNYQSFTPRLYHCQSTGVYYHRRPQDPSAAVGSVAPSHHHPHHPAFRHPHATHTTPCSINYSMTSSHGRPSFSLSSSGYSPSRRQSSVQQNPLSNYYAGTPLASCLPYPGMSHRQTDPVLTEQRTVGGFDYESNKSTPVPELGTQVRHHSLLPLPANFKLSPDRKIKSAEDLKSLVLELTWASKRYRHHDQEQLIAESYQ
jgi:hypothetical protein